MLNSTCDKAIAEVKELIGGGKLPGRRRLVRSDAYETFETRLAAAINLAMILPANPPRSALVELLEASRTSRVGAGRLEDLHMQLKVVRKHL